MKSEYFLSQILLIFLTFVITFVSFVIIDNDSIMFPIIISAGVFVLSFISTPICISMIMLGNKFEGLKKICYYCLIPVILTILCILVMTFFQNVEVEGLLGFLLVLVCSAGICVGIVLPFLQFIIVMIIRKLRGNEKKEC